jgi:tetratricopeptide (TPR) repeat protein
MYANRSRRRRSSLRRVLIYLILIGAGVWIIVNQNQLRQELIPPPTPTATRTARSYVVEAESLREAGNVPAAIDAYIQAVSLEPQNLDVLITLSRLLALRGQTLEAVHYAERAAQLAPQDVKAQAALTMAYGWHASWLQQHGRELESKDTYQKAVTTGKTAVALDPKYPESYAYLAETYTDLGSLENAIDNAQTAVDLDPNRADVQRALGYVRESQGNYSGAVEAYQRAIELAPRQTYLYVALGRNYRVLAAIRDASLWAKATEAFQRATEIDPSYSVAFDELGWTYYALEDYKTAQQTLEKAVEVDPANWSARSHLAAAYFARRNYEDATVTFKKALDLMNQSFDGDHYCVTAQSGSCERMVTAYATMGLAYCYLDQYQNEAIPAFRKALTIRPDDPGVLDTMNYCYTYLGTPVPRTPVPGQN